MTGSLIGTNIQININQKYMSDKIITKEGKELLEITKTTVEELKKEQVQMELDGCDIEIGHIETELETIRARKVVLETQLKLFKK